MFPCPDFVRQLIEYFQRFFAPVDHDHDAEYPPLGHDHDDTYYTESEVDALLAGKADDDHTHLVPDGVVQEIVIVQATTTSYVYTDDGSEVQIPNFAAMLYVGAYNAVEVIGRIPVVKSTTGAAYNVRCKISCGGQTISCSSHILGLVNQKSVDIPIYAVFTGLSEGWQTVTVKIHPGNTETYETADETYRLPYMTAKQIKGVGI